jgi:heme A synthase
MLISILIALVIAGVILWALGQFPIDPTLARIIRVVVIVVVVLYCLGALTGRSFVPGL